MSTSFAANADEQNPLTSAWNEITPVPHDQIKSSGNELDSILAKLTIIETQIKDIPSDDVQEAFDMIKDYIIDTTDKLLDKTAESVSLYKDLAEKTSVITNLSDALKNQEINEKSDHCEHASCKELKAVNAELRSLIMYMIAMKPVSNFQSALNGYQPPTPHHPLGNMPTSGKW